MVNKYLLSIGMFFINPLFGAFVSLLNSKNSPRLYVFLVSMSFGILGYTFVPVETMDLATYYKNITLYSGYTYIELFNESTNVIMRSYLKFIHDLGLNKEFIPFFVTFLSYFLYVKSYSSFILNRNHRVTIFLNVLVILTVSFLASANGLRNGLSTAFIICALSQVYVNKKTNFLILSFCAMSIHSYTIAIFLIILLSINVKKINGNVFKLVLVGSVFFSLLSNGEQIKQVALLLSSLNSSMESIVKIYINGSEWGGGATFNEKVKLIKLIELSPLYGSIFFLLRTREFNSIYIVASLLCCLSLLTSDFWVISERYAYSAILVTLMFFFSIKPNFKYFITMAILQIIVLIWSLFRYRYSYMESYTNVFYPSIINMYFSAGRDFIEATF